jgi:hypothetical protein
MQLSAVSEKNVHANPDGFLVLAGIELQLHFVAFLERIVRPAQPNQVARIIQFDAPINNFASVVLGVQKNYAMGISPYESRNGALHADPFREIVALRPVVRHDRATKGQKATGEAKKRQQSKFHPCISEFEPLTIGPTM